MPYNGPERPWWQDVTIAEFKQRVKDLPSQELFALRAEMLATIERIDDQLDADDESGGERTDEWYSKAVAARGFTKDKKRFVNAEIDYRDRALKTNQLTGEIAKSHVEAVELDRTKKSEESRLKQNLVDAKNQLEKAARRRHAAMVNEIRYEQLTAAKQLLDKGDNNGALAALITNLLADWEVAKKQSALKESIEAHRDEMHAAREVEMEKRYRYLTDARDLLEKGDFEGSLRALVGFSIARWNASQIAGTRPGDTPKDLL